MSFKIELSTKEAKIVKYSAEFGSEYGPNTKLRKKFKEHKYVVDKVSENFELMEYEIKALIFFIEAGCLYEEYSRKEDNICAKVVKRLYVICDPNHGYQDAQLLADAQEELEEARKELEEVQQRYDYKLAAIPKYCLKTLEEDDRHWVVEFGDPKYYEPENVCDSWLAAQEEAIRRNEGN